MKVLLSAYACEPDRGSEPGVGFRWALALAQMGHEVHVVTRSNNEPAIRGALPELPEGLSFHYFDLPQKYITATKRYARSPHLYYILWQWRVARVAKSLHRQLGFDVVHHLTFGSIRLPTFINLPGVPLIVGPLGGGESAPRALRRHFPLRGRFVDSLRDVSNCFIKVDPVMRRVFDRAAIILLKTPDSLQYVDYRQRHKAIVHLEVGLETAPVGSTNVPGGRRPIQVLFVGRHIYWKGMGLGLPAFAQAYARNPDLRLTMVGDGPEAKAWKAQAERLGIDHRIQWLGWIPRSDLSELYASHDIFFFPSLHDSSGNVIVEAVSNGLPIVCLDLGGPGRIVDSRCGYKVTVAGLGEEKVIATLADCLLRAAADVLAGGAAGMDIAGWSENMTWSRRVALVYDDRFGGKGAKGEVAP